MNTIGMLVDHAALDLATDQLRIAVGALDERLHELTNDLAPLTEAWEGEAQAAYLAAKAQWDSAIADMRTVLDRTRVSVAQSNQEYAAADRRGARAFGG